MRRSSVTADADLAKKAGRDGTTGFEQLAEDRGAVDQDALWDNADGEHGTPYYCSGRPRPRFRGSMHLYSAMAAPLWTAYQLTLCDSAQEYAAVLIACAGAACMLGASGCYHRLYWRTEAREEIASKIDHSGIYLQVAFSATPLYIFMLPAPYGWGVVGILAICALVGILIVFSPVQLNRHVGTAIYVAMGLAQLLPLSGLGLPTSILARMTATEQRLLATLVASYLVGSQVYANALPRLWPRTFGFHELWHLLVMIGTASSYAINCSLLMRGAGPG